MSSRIMQARLKPRCGSPFWATLAFIYGVAWSDWMWGVIGGAADTAQNVVLLADMVHGPWDEGDLQLLLTPGDGATFLDLVLEPKVPRRRWNIISTSRSADPNSTELGDEPRSLKRANVGYSRVRTRAPEAIPLPSYTLLRIRKELYDLKDNLDNWGFPASNVSLQNNEGAKRGGEDLEGEWKEEEYREAKGSRIRNAGNNRKRDRGTTKHSAPNTSGIAETSTAPTPSGDDLFPDCLGVPHIDRTSFLYEDGPGLPEKWPECRNPDCYIQPIIRYETEDERDDDWEVAETPNVTQIREKIAELDPDGEGLFAGDDCADVMDRDGVEVAVAGYVEVGDCETPDEMNAELDPLKEVQQKGFSLCHRNSNRRN